MNVHQIANRLILFKELKFSSYRFGPETIFRVLQGTHSLNNIKP